MTIRTRDDFLLAMKYVERFAKGAQEIPVYPATDAMCMLEELVSKCTTFLAFRDAGIVETVPDPEDNVVRLYDFKRRAKGTDHVKPL